MNYYKINIGMKNKDINSDFLTGFMIVIAVVLISLLLFSCNEPEDQRKARLENEKTVIYIENVYYLNDTTK